MHAQVNTAMAAQGEERDLTKPAVTPVAVAPVAVAPVVKAQVHQHALSWTQMAQSLAAGGIAGAVCVSASSALF